MTGDASEYYTKDELLNEHTYRLMWWYLKNKLSHSKRVQLYTLCLEGEVISDAANNLLVEHILRKHKLSTVIFNSVKFATLNLLRKIRKNQYSVESLTEINEPISFTRDSLHSPDRERIERFLGVLDNKSQTIIRHRYGFVNELTCEEVGQLFNPPISKQRVNILERQALESLRKVCINYGYIK